MAVYNVTEQMAKEALHDSVFRSIMACTCQLCQDDALAIALNRLPVRYVATQQGEAYVKANYMQPQLQSDVLRELTRAAQVVSANPRHEQATGGTSQSNG
ncbi:late competence development ComFB family protein [Alicyclobacillus dauci]|uniref:Late competence development ComFB family protein n=1 Tax=Alicyclobacillus dauci TaxID=1475485 RepID=A0ABY6Z3H4_9BACL|nr:late competence development ComFB family protein [Alicyclobacillus dauci]WAH37299.1 late competence development ComFB family protein [Alicyclobacillus dauci]